MQVEHVIVRKRLVLAEGHLALRDKGADAAPLDLLARQLRSNSYGDLDGRVIID